MNSTIPSIADFYRALPELLWCGFGLLAMFLQPFVRNRHFFTGLAFIGALAGTAGSCLSFRNPGAGFYGLIQADAFSFFFHLLVGTVAVLVVLAAGPYLDRERLPVAEFYALLLFATAGMGVLASAQELLTAFIGLEMSSISSYILAGYRRESLKAGESAMKYFLLGSFATAFFLYGIALVYGATGTTNLLKMASPGASSPLLKLGLALIFIGLGFKVAAAPFHIWTPDVYEGAPSPVVGFMSTAPKAAVFAVLLRIMFQTHAPGRIWLIWVAAALSMTIGNIAALVQDNIKRLLAYSSIAHAGYLLIAFAALPANGIPAAMFYTASYAAMNVGAFAVVGHFAGLGERKVTLEDYSGLGRRSPLLAAILTMFLLSLIGIPITGGFFAKFYVFSAALQANLIGLTIIGVLNSAVAAYYYLRVIIFMYMREPREEATVSPIPAGLGVALALSLAATIYLGVLPGRVLEYAGRSVGLLR